MNEPLKTVAAPVRLNNVQDAAALAQMAKALALSNGYRSQAAVVAEARGMPSRVVNILKASVPAGGTGSWGADLVDNQIVVSAFVSLLRNHSAFYRLLDSGAVRLPFNARIGVVVQGVTAWIVNEGKPTPISAMGFTNDELKSQLAAAMIVLTDELVRATQSDAIISLELRRGIAAVVDAAFFGSMIDNDTPTQVSAGAGAAGVRTDMRFLFDAVGLKAESRPMLVMAPNVARAASLIGDGGGFLFPDMGPTGGTMRQIPAMVSDGLDAGTIALVDATGIAAESETINIEASNETTIEMADNPTQDATTGTGAQMVSMFQTNCTAILAKAFFGSKRLRDNALATVTGVAWE